MFKKGKQSESKGTDDREAELVGGAAMDEGTSEAK